MGITAVEVVVALVLISQLCASSAPLYSPCSGRHCPRSQERRAPSCWTGRMFETAEEVTELQALLDASMASAGPHLRDIADEHGLGAIELTERLQGMRLVVLATVTADGRPLAGPVDGYFLHGTFWFSTGRNAVR